MPFEVRIRRLDEDDFKLDSSGLMKKAIEKTLLPVVQNCFDRDPDIAPNTADEAFGCLVERDDKYAKRVVFAVRHM